MFHLHHVLHPQARLIQGLILCIVWVAGFSPTAEAQMIHGLSGNNLVAFDAASPSTLIGNKSVSGVIAGQTLAGLDFRPNTGELYALGYNTTTGEARLYTLNLNTAAATAIGTAPLMLKPGLGKIGFDFNPTVDRIRVTGSDNSNYRLHPVTGALVATDGSLAFAATDANAGKNPSIGTVAYTNSYIGATATTLFNYDDSLNTVTTQIPPNNGTLNTVGASGITVNPADPSADLDIYFDAASAMNRAFLVANTGADITDNLYTINLTTGAATLVGTTGMALDDIAVFIDRNVPATVTGRLVYALSANNNLLSFDSDAPGMIRKSAAVGAVATGLVLSGLDFRPSTGELYTLGYNPMTGETRLYTIDPATGAVTAIGTASVTLKPGLGKISFDFNPTVDRIRVTGSDNSNYRLHPVTGALAATDAGLAFAPADANAGTNPSIGAVAYINSFNGATTTVLYNYDDSLNVITTQNPPNNGVLNTVGASGISVNPADPSADMDIFYNPFNGANQAYLSANTGTSTADHLYSLNLGTGAAILIGKIGFGIAINDIAIAVQPLETACDVKTVNCMKYEVLNVSKDASGNKTYRVRVTNNCAENLFYTAFQLPNGLIADGPANNSVYSSPGGHSYEVRNPNFSPFYSIRFKETSGNGIANGQFDVFEYTLPAAASPNYIHVVSRVGTQSYHEAYLNVFSCTVGNTLQPATKPGTEDRSDFYAGNELRVFPNPTDGVLVADLTAWTNREVNIRVYNALGQQVINLAAAGGNLEQLQIPDQAAAGLYFIEFSTAEGQKQVKKVQLRR
ncbi:MAG: DUF4394 domain-containing protein [Lewinellaceae bacterium]|nr:DUF4394 domain-containing protein [Lewinellaceae bacterium]